MFVGGFQTNFKNNIFTATLPVGKSLHSNDWKIKTEHEHKGLWILEGSNPNGDRKNWSQSPKLILDCDEGAEWYRNGIGCPNGYYGESEYDKNTLYLFFTGLHQKRNWFNIRLKN